MTDLIDFYWARAESVHLLISREELPSVLREVIRDGGRAMWVFVDGRIIPRIPQDMSEDEALSSLVEACEQASSIHIAPPLVGGPGPSSNLEEIGDALNLEQFRTELIDDYGEGDGRVEQFTTLMGELDGIHTTIHERGIVVTSGPFVLTTEIPALVEFLKQEPTSEPGPRLLCTHIQHGEESTSKCLQFTPVGDVVHFADLLRMFAYGLYNLRGGVSPAIIEPPTAELEEG